MSECNDIEYFILQKQIEVVFIIEREEHELTPNGFYFKKLTSVELIKGLIFITFYIVNCHELFNIFTQITEH